MHDAALKRSDRSVLRHSSTFWSVGLLALAFMVLSVCWICSIEPARAAETTYAASVAGTENGLGKEGLPESQRSWAERFSELSGKYEEQKKELTELQEEYDRLRVSRRVRWYLLGAAVFLVGWIIGFSARRKPKRYSLET